MCGLASLRSPEDPALLEAYHTLTSTTATNSGDTTTATNSGDTTHTSTTSGVTSTTTTTAASNSISSGSTSGSGGSNGSTANAATATADSATTDSATTDSATTDSAEETLAAHLIQLLPPRDTTSPPLASSSLQLLSQVTHPINTPYNTLYQHTPTNAPLTI